MQASEWLNPGAIDGSERRCNDAFRQPSKAQAVLYTLHARHRRQREEKTKLTSPVKECNPFVTAD